MNKKKKSANKKHYKTRVRLKTLNDLSLKKMKKKPAKVSDSKEEVIVESVQKDTAKLNESTAKKPAEKKKPAKKKKQ